MLRKMMIALLAVAAVGLVSPTVASARGGHGFHGGGFHGGFHGGGFHHGFYGRGFGWGLGLGLAAPYAYGWGYPYGYYGYPYAYGGYVDDGGCYLVRRRIHTRHGWRWRRVEVCE